MADNIVNWIYICCLFMFLVNGLSLYVSLRSGLTRKLNYLCSVLALLWLGDVCLLLFHFRPAGAISYHYLLCSTVINLKVLNVQDLSRTLPLILKG